MSEQQIILRQPQDLKRSRETSSSESGNSSNHDSDVNNMQLMTTRSSEVRRPPQKLGKINLATILTYPPDPKTIKQAKNSEDWIHWKTACEEELNSLRENHVWEFAELPKEKQLITCRWVLTRKFNADGSLNRYKARLVAPGFSQKEGEDFDEIFAPTVHFESIRAVLAFALQQDFEIHQLDVKTAFLYGKLEEEIYLEQPPGFEENNKVWRLKRSLYGLKQAPRYWNKVLREYLLNQGFEQSLEDYGIFKKFSKNLCLFLVIYVDDILVIGNSLRSVNWFKEVMKMKFKMSDMGEIGYFLGMSAERNKKKGTLLLHQHKYVQDILKKYNMMECNTTITPMEAVSTNGSTKIEEKDWNAAKTPYQNVVGSLIYLVTCTRPDIAYAVGIVARYSSSFEKQHWHWVKRILRYLKGTANFGIMFQRKSAIDMYGYSDADWADDMETRKSTSGRIIMINGCPIIWKSKRQRTVADSSTHAEYMALTPTVKDVVWLRRLVNFLGVQLDLPTTIFEDNLPAIKIAMNPVFHDRSKHFEVQYHFTREKIQEQAIKLQHLSTQEMVADILTKPMPGPRFKLLSNQMMNC